mmetsp:Transcript_45938/g.143764  ORF Transcript_45938/g.143764 Transcript_45938/m.143764 type:complete len:146 (-) Transcript_45938:294-731(-)
MGGSHSAEAATSSVAAYTLYGFGCGRCSSPCVFVPGAPKDDCCGTTCSHVEFEKPISLGDALEELEADLDEAAAIAEKHTTWCSQVFCSGVDTTAGGVARALNDEWCANWNEKFEPLGYKVRAFREVYGFGRSRVTFVVLRVMSQ